MISQTVHSQLSKRFHSVSELRGELQDLRKEDLVEYTKKSEKKTKRGTPLHKSRNDLSSTKGLKLLYIFILFVITWLK